MSRSGANRKPVRANVRRLSPAVTRQLAQIVQSNTRDVIPAVVEKSIKETLLRFGIVTETQVAVVEIQKDFAFVRRSRTIFESRPAQIFMAILVAGLAVVSGVSVHAATLYLWPPK